MNGLYPKGLIGSIYKNETVKFLEFVDDEKDFLKNLNANPDWEYKNIEIEYSYNIYGHRCIDPKLLNGEYLLFAGCSLTEGVGLKLEHTYPYIVSQEFNIPYYNISVSGSSPEILMQNVVLFLSMIQQKPKHIIIQWPFFHRYYILNNKGMIHYYNGSSDDTDELYRVLVENYVPEGKNIFYRNVLLEYLNNLGIKNIYEIETEFDYAYLPSNVNTIRFRDFFDYANYPRARDLSHPGIIPHGLQAREIIGKIKNYQ